MTVTQIDSAYAGERTFGKAVLSHLYRLVGTKGHGVTMIIVQKLQLEIWQGSGDVLGCTVRFDGSTRVGSASISGYGEAISMNKRLSHVAYNALKNAGYHFDVDWQTKGESAIYSALLAIAHTDKRLHTATVDLIRVPTADFIRS